jgi:hypothetical protein
MKTHRCGMRDIIIGWGLFFLILFAGALRIPAEEVMPEAVSFKTGAPGNIFYAGQKVVISLAFDMQGGQPPQKITTHLQNDANESLLAHIFAVPQSPGAIIEDGLGSIPPGYYTYIADLEYQDGKTASAFCKFGVIRKPRNVTPPEKSPFAIDAFLSWRTQSPELVRSASDVLRRLGIVWVRDRISWNHVQPASGRWDWSRYDISEKAQAEGGLRILQVFQETAVWASEKKEGEARVRQKSAPEDTLTYYNFASEAAGRYKKGVAAWEIWNEFDIPVFFLGSADEYTRTLKAGYLGIKQGNPQADVLLGSVTFGSGEITFGPETYFDKEGERYIEKVFENGGGEYFDIFNVHHYGPVEGISGKIARCRNLMRRFGYDKPIWLTEIGSTSSAKMGNSVAESEHKQAYYLVRAYTLALAEGVERIFYFCLPDFIEHGVSNWGIMEERRGVWQPKPALIALANLIGALDGMRCHGRYDTHLPVEALLFKKGARGCLILWSRDGKRYKPTVFFRSLQKNPVIRHIYGEEIERHNIMVCTLDVGAEPLFFYNFDLYDLDQTLFSGQAGKTSLAPSEFYGSLKEVWVELRDGGARLEMDTETIKGEARIYNLSDKRRGGTLFLDVLPTSQTSVGLLASHVEAPVPGPLCVPFEVAVPKEWRKTLAENAGSELILKARFKDDISGKESLPAVRYYEFHPPIDISQPALMDPEAEEPITTVTLTNLSGHPLPVTLTLAPESHYRCLAPVRRITLAKDERRAVAFSLQPLPPRAGAALSSRVKIIAQAGEMEFRRSAFLETGGIARTFLPFEIDGKPGGWGYFQPFTIEGRENFVQGMDLLQKTGEVRGKVFTAWDEKNLYVFCIVEDRDVTNPFREANPWTGDALELFFDMRAGDAAGRPAYGASVFQIFAVPPDAAHPQSMFKVWQPEGVEFKGVSLASAVMPDYYTIEMAIPWENLTLETVGAGFEFGMEFIIDDVDTGDYAHRQIIWRGGADNWRNPSLFSRVLLVTHLRNP